ncbi:hypothetical protein ACFSUK_04620 [Sphingobium scionense]
MENDVLARETAYGLEGFAKVAALDIIFDAPLVLGKGSGGGHQRADRHRRKERIPNARPYSNHSLPPLKFPTI